MGAGHGKTKSGSQAHRTVRGEGKAGPAMESNQSQDIVRRFFWDMLRSIVHLDEIRHFWAQTIGISKPQWMILITVAELDRGHGVP